MIFPMDPPRRASFWMKNTVISLDLVFIGPDHKVLNVAANAVPYDPTPLSAIDTTGSVLELNAGRAAQIVAAVMPEVEIITTARARVFITSCAVALATASPKLRCPCVAASCAWVPASRVWNW